MNEGSLSVNGSLMPGRFADREPDRSPDSYAPQQPGNTANPLGSPMMSQLDFRERPRAHTLQLVAVDCLQHSVEERATIAPPGISPFSGREMVLIRRSIQRTVVSLFGPPSFRVCSHPENRSVI